MENVYMKPYIIVELRDAVKEDFSHPDGSKKPNVLYYQRSHTGYIEHKPCYFNADTNMRNFKELYAAKQILVPDALFYAPIELQENPTIN